MLENGKISSDTEHDQVHPALILFSLWHKHKWLRKWSWTIEYFVKSLINLEMYFV